MAFNPRSFAGGKFLCCVAAFRLSLALAASPALAWSSKSHYDNQFWPEIKTKTHLSQLVDFILEGQLRVGRDISTLVREQGTAGFDFHGVKYFTLSVRYLSIGDQPTHNSKTYENRFQFYPTIHLKFGGLKINLVNMFEYRFRYPVNDSARYRPSLTLEHPLGPKHWGLSAYVKEEGFYSTQYNDFYRLRSYVGLKKKLHEDISLELYYCRQQDGLTIPGNLNIIGTAVAFEFDLPKLLGRPGRRGD